MPVQPDLPQPPPDARRFVRSTRVEAPAEEVYRWHAEPGALQRLTPPWEPVEVVKETGGLEDGTEVTLKIRVGPVPVYWVSRLSGCVPGRGFRDTQIRGPFAFWQHSHSMIPDGERACLLEDSILYALPFGAPGRWLGEPLVRARLEKMFAYRHRLTREAFSGKEAL